MLTRLITKRTAIVLAAFALALPCLLWCVLYYYLGVWPPDIGSSKVSLLASAESTSGERFRVVQFLGSDMYTTQVEQISPDGTESVSIIDGDDRKQWLCSVDVIEEKKAVVITFSDGSPVIRYQWDEKKLYD